MPTSGDLTDRGKERDETHRGAQCLFIRSSLPPSCVPPLPTAESTPIRQPCGLLLTLPPQRANILKEVQIMRNLDHPNIVQLVEFSEAKQYYYIVLELCPGGELFHQIVRLTYFSEDLSRHVIKQVAESLLYLHEEAGVVHR